MEVQGQSSKHIFVGSKLTILTTYGLGSSLTIQLANFTFSKSSKALLRVYVTSR
jgi:hypothetical protein